MSMLGRRYDAETLERWNVINRVVDDEHLAEAPQAAAAAPEPDLGDAELAVDVELVDPSGGPDYLD